MEARTEEEQVEALKAWWDKNGRLAIIAVVVVIAAIIGVRSWMDYTQQKAELAALEYEQLLSHVAKGDSKLIETTGERIIANYDATPYADLAALMLAKVKYLAGDSQASRNYLQQVIDSGEQEPVQHIARIRLLRIMLEAGENKQALTLIENTPFGGFTAAYEELKGDVYLAMGNAEQARAAYGRALEAGAENRATVQIKFDDLTPADSTAVKGE